MYTNGYTGNRYLSIVWFIDAGGLTHVYMHSDFVTKSEHVTVQTARTVDDTPGYNPYDHTLPSLLRRQAE